jgi:hypothetical protein
MAAATWMLAHRLPDLDFEVVARFVTREDLDAALLEFAELVKRD